VTKAANVSYEEGGVRKQLDQSVQKIWSLNEWVQPGLKKVLGQGKALEVELASIWLTSRAFIGSDKRGLEDWNKKVVPQMELYFENRLGELESAWNLSELLKVLGDPSLQDRLNAMRVSKGTSLFDQFKDLLSDTPEKQKLFTLENISLLKKNA
jgi:hypothetical protein